MKDIKITKAKIIDGIFLELEYTETDADGDSTVSTDYKALCRKRIHEDLRAAFDKLKIHLALLSEIVPDDLAAQFMFEDGSIYKDELNIFKSFAVNGIALGGSDEHHGVTLIGRKTLRGKRILNLNSPFTKFQEQEGQENYRFLHNLYSDSMQCVEEVEAYLNGKHAPDPQLTIEI
jgi:hypothetical protein